MILQARDLLSLSLWVTLGFAVAPAARPQTWTLEEVGTSGVIAMEAIVVSPTLVLFFDRPADNPNISINNHTAWGALYNLETNTATALDLVTNSFCSSGAFLSNGTMINLGGTNAGLGLPVPDPDGDQDGLQAVRIFEPCDDPAGVGCTVFEDTANIHLAVARWYPTTVKVFDGSLLTVGGTAFPTPFYNVDPVNSFEFFPPKDGGVPRPSQFLADSLPANLFPRAFSLPDGKVFMVANNISQIYDIEANTETRLPEIPNNVRVTNPFDGTGTLLPLSPPDYIPEVLICGGTNISDTIQPANISSQTPASNQCSRITLTPEGIKKGWVVEHMLEARMMGEMVLMPNGQVLIINGAQTGTAAFGSVMDPVGPSSNADHPAFTPSLYTPSAPLGKRFSNKGMPTATIPRMYHSSVTLTGSGNILLAGSNPNGPFTSGTEFPSEIRVENLNPPFMFGPRPSLLKMPSKILFNQQITVPISIPSSLKATDIKVSLMDLGFSSHAWHSSQRLVFLVAHISPNRKSLTLRAPPNGRVFPPGPAFVFLTIDDVTSVGARIMVGSGASPPVLE